MVYPLRWKNWKEIQQKRKKNEEDLFSSDEENGSISIVDEIISKLDVNKLLKDQLVSKSMEAWCLDNSKQLLSEAIHQFAVVVSETGEEIQKVPVESTSDTTISSPQSDSDSDEPLVIIRRRMKNKGVHDSYPEFLIAFKSS